jgi:hypothetical protein
MANTNPKLPLTGRNVTVTLFLNGRPLPQTDVARSVEIDEVATMFRDKYLGRDRDRTDKNVDGYDVKLELDYTDASLITALLQQQAARDANGAIPSLSLGMTLLNRDGTADGYIVQNCTSKFNFNFKGKDERGMVRLELQGEDIKTQVL